MVHVRDVEGGAIAGAEGRVTTGALATVATAVTNEVGTFTLEGELPVNTDGGLKSFGHPTGATGVRMIYENVMQLQGRAEKRQVKNATTALSHNIGGPPTTCGIAILGMN